MVRIFTFGIFVSLIAVFPGVVHGQCIQGEPAFKSGEVLHYRVVYNWGLVWLESGDSEFNVKSGSHAGRPTFRFTGKGGTNTGYDWFFKVRDHFTTELDSQTFKPLKFEATMNEGSKHDRHTYIFDGAQKTAYTVITRGKKPPEVDTVNLRSCSMDVLSAIYYARSIDYSQCRVNDTLGMSLLIDGKLFPVHIRYLGRDTYQSEELGTFRCIKFSPLLVEGSIFKEGEGMTVWVTDDQNKVPLFIETPIVVGMIKVILSRYENLKYPVNARVAQ